MEIVVGTYDEVLIGFRVIKIGQALQLETNFTDNSHTGCIKCITISPKGVLASGSTDETIRLLNIKKKKEVGSLVHHSGTVTSLEFQKSFLFSTSEDKTLCLWKSQNWECQKTFRAHKYGVNCASVHPSGKLALSVGCDRKLITWNLITGKTAYITNIKEVADIVKWSPDGDLYLIVVNNKIDVYSVQTAEITTTIKSDTRINCLEFYSNEVCVYGGEGGKVIFYNISSNQILCTCDTATSRIKGMCITKSPLEEDSLVLCVGSSDGRVQIHEIKQQNDKISTSLLVDHNASFRITCMAVYNRPSVQQQSDLDENAVEVSEIDDDSKTDKLERSTIKQKANIDEEDLNLVSKSLYDEELSKEKTGKKKRKSISFGESFTVESNVDNKGKFVKKRLHDGDTGGYQEEVKKKKITKEKKKEMPFMLQETVTVTQEKDKLVKKKEKRAELLKKRHKAKQTEKRKNKKEMDRSKTMQHKRNKQNGKKEAKNKARPKN